MHGRTSISIEGRANSADNCFLIREQGSQLDFFVQGSHSDLADFTSTTTSISDTQLIVGKGSSQAGNDLLKWWVNPDVCLGKSDHTLTPTWQL